jgi:hypothetical protein
VQFAGDPKRQLRGGISAFEALAVAARRPWPTLGSHPGRARARRAAPRSPGTGARTGRPQRSPGGRARSASRGRARTGSRAGIEARGCPLPPTSPGGDRGLEARITRAPIAALRAPEVRAQLTRRRALGRRVPSAVELHQVADRGWSPRVHHAFPLLLAVALLRRVGVVAVELRRDRIEDPALAIREVRSNRRTRTRTIPRYVRAPSLLGLALALAGARFGVVLGHGP